MSDKRPGWAVNFVVGGAAAIVSKTASAPFERVKLLLQSQHEIVRAGRLKEPYKGAIDCTVRTFRTEGFFPFWRGNIASILVYFPSQAINFALKDQFKHLFPVSKNDPYVKKFGANVMSGCLAGGLTISVAYPLDFARTRLANDTKVSVKNRADRQFKGMVDVYRQILRSDGVTGLYRGFVVSFVGIIVYRGCYFGLFDSLKPMVLGDNASFPAMFVLGYGVTVSAGLLAYPMDTVRCRMMMRSGETVKYKGSIDCATQILKNESLLSFWKGAVVSILRGAVGAAMLVGYEQGKKRYMTWRNRS